MSRNSVYAGHRVRDGAVFFVAFAFMVALLSSGQAADLEKGPYLIYPNDPSQMVVMAQAAAPPGSCTIEWGTNASYDSGPVSMEGFGFDNQFAYVISNLTADTRYYYRVTVDGAEHGSTFTTAPPLTESNTVMYCVGDTRSNPDQQDAILAALRDDMDAALTDKESIWLHVGDWVSSGEIESTWNNEFFNRNYTNSLEVQSRLPAMGCRGNHEGIGTVYTKYFPYNDYVQTAVVPAPAPSDMYYSFDYGPVHVAVIDDNISCARGSAQRDWLEADLQGSDREWLFLVFHQPAYSAGGHGNLPENQLLVSQLNTLPCVNVDLALVGHNHYYARCENSGVVHLTLGGGGAPLYTPNLALESVIVAAEKLSFARFDINDKQLDCVVKDETGALLDSFSLYHTPDSTPPQLLSAVSETTHSSVSLFFDEVVEAGTGTGGAENTLNYSIPGHTIMSATRTTAPQVEVGVTPDFMLGNTYTVTVVNVQDMDGNALVSDTAEFTAQIHSTAIAVGDTWSYFKGTADPGADWNKISCDDSAWLTGPTGIGYADIDDATVLSDMQGSYTTVFMRKKFTVSEYIDELKLTVDYDDGYAAYLNGNLISSRQAPAGISYTSVATGTREAGTPVTDIIDALTAGLVQGENVLAVVLLNDAIGSSDASMIPSLTLVRNSPNYEVTYDGNNADAGSAPVDSIPHGAGESVTVLGNLENLSRSGYAFTGWNTQTNGGGTSYVPDDTFLIASNMTLYALWTPAVTYTLVVANGTGDGEYAEGAEVYIAADAAPAGEVFDAWAGDTGTVATATDASTTVTMPSRDITLTANFAVDPVVVVSQDFTPVGYTSAELSGVLSDGAAALAWLCWGASDGGTSSTGDWANVVSLGTVTEGVGFTNLVSGLSTNMTYFYRCYAASASSSDWSDPAVSFSGTPASEMGGGETWTPSNIATFAWYDASDLSTVTTNASGDVTEWADKTGKTSADLTTVLGTPKSGTRSIDSKNVIDFNGASSLLETGIPYTSGDIACVMVATVDVVDHDDDTIVLFRCENDNAVDISAGNGSQFNGAIGYLNTYTTQPFSDGPYEDAPHLFGLSYDYNGASNSVGYVDGDCVTSTQTVALAINRLGAATTAIKIFANNSNTRKPDGACAEAVFFEDMSDETRTMVEGYLAWKWGLQNNLPEGHPYKATPPGGGGTATIANVAPSSIQADGATLNANLDATGTNYDVYVHYGTSDGGTNAGSWTSSEYVGSWTNVSTNVSFAASGLTADTQYHFTFMASNATETAWASPSWTFSTLGAPQATANHTVPYAWLDLVVPGSGSDYEAAVTNDPDGDGFATWEEYWCGTDPTNAASYFKIGTVEYDGAQITIRWEHARVDPGIPPIAIQGCTDLNGGSWRNLGSRAPVDGTNSWSASGPTGGFYRLAVTNAP